MYVLLIFYLLKFEDLDKYCNLKFYNLVNIFYKLKSLIKKKDLIEN